MPAGRTYTPIATTTLSTTSASVTFSGISGSYTDLILACSNIRITTTSTPAVAIRFNSDSGANYSTTNLDGTGTVASSGRYTSATYIQAGYNVGINNASEGICIFNIMNYSNTTTHKTVVERHNFTNSTASGTGAAVGLWRNTSAITSVTVQPDDFTWQSGVTFTLYGILAA